MTRPLRADAPTKNLTIRISPNERAEWMARSRGNISNWLRMAASLAIREEQIKKIMGTTGVTRDEAEVAYTDGKRLADALVKAHKARQEENASSDVHCDDDDPDSDLDTTMCGRQRSHVSSYPSDVFRNHIGRVASCDVCTQLVTDAIRMGDIGR